jgi:hypothetical protein
METLIFDTIGYIGVGFYVLPYALLNLGKLDGNGALYLFLNMTAASLLLISLSHTFNGPSVLIQSTWIVLSIIGISKIFYRKHQAKRIKKMANAS